MHLAWNYTLYCITKNNSTHVNTGGCGPPLYEAASVATSVIYWPADRGDGTTETNFAAESSASLGELPNYLPNGGAILSVYQPTTSLAWLEENYDLPIVQSIRNSKKFSGPLAMLLFPEEPALAIFGPRTDLKFAEKAQNLSNTCGYPVICRPFEERPMFRPTENFFAPPESVNVTSLQNIVHDNDGVFPDDNGNRTGNGLSSTAGRDGNGTNDSGSSPGNDSPEANRGSSSGSSENGVSNAGAEKKFNDDVGGDPDDDGDDPGAYTSDEWEDWASPIHLTTYHIRSPTNNECLNLNIFCRTQFKTYANDILPNNPTKEWAQQDMTRKQAQVHTKLEIRGREILLDRSYVSLEFEAHRPLAITRDEMNQLSISKRQTFRITSPLPLGRQGISRSPTSGGTYAYNRSTTHTVEAADSKPMPLYDMAADPGDSYSDEDKSWSSYIYSYKQRDDLIKMKAGQQPPIDVGFAFGINLHPYDEEGKSIPPPRVSYINRNQLFLWIQDESLRSKMLGVVLLLTNPVPDIRTRSSLVTREELTVDFETGRSIERKAEKERNKGSGTVSLSIVPLGKHKYTPEGRRRFKAFHNANN
ncbi:hypothetical protein DFH09DRAFT_1276315 [Mycena vulgaris]|nr:hypothetical protein DFH09DRAFT_1276315 [Mycena vulgaris]